MESLPRPAHVRQVRTLLHESPVVALLGARQVGKTTLARAVAESSRGAVHFFDLEDRDDLAALAEPKAALAPLRGLVVLDEVQRVPDLFTTLRVLADRPRTPARFLVLGGASPDLLRQTAESLAGRIAFHELGPFALDEVGADAADRLWLRGGFARSFLAADDAASARWRRDFALTFVERDLPQLGVTIPAQTLSRFWAMLAHTHGQVFNATEIGRAFGVAHTTVARWLDLLCATYMVRRLQPWHENLSKRQVKTAKVYLTDTGMLHELLDIVTPEGLLRHPKCGASWESFAMETVIRRLGARREQCHFWATHASAELDLLVVAGDRRLGFEIKRTTAPKVTPSMRIALASLRLERLDVVHAGDRTFPMGDRIRAVPLRGVLTDVAPLSRQGRR
jgi:predicted AAA+ superfamily ATPase